jgi:hypothetical protein
MKFEEVKKFFKDNVSYKDWEFHIKKKMTNGVEQDAFYFQIQFVAPDNFNGNPERQYCRKWLLSEFMTPTELVRTAWLAVQQAERHEMEENFKYKGSDIFNSHLEVDALAILCKLNKYEHRKVSREQIDKMCDDSRRKVSAMSREEKDELTKKAHAYMDSFDETRKQARKVLGL